MSGCRAYVLTGVAALLTGASCAEIDLSAVDVRTLALPWTRHTIDDGSDGADGVRLMDVNADGLPDVVTGWEEGGLIRVCLHPGVDAVESRWPAVTVGRVGSPEDAVFVDLDGDGAVDVVSSCEGGMRTMFVHWAPTEPEDYLRSLTWRTEAITATVDKRQWMFAVPMDVDGDGDADLVAGAKGDNAAIGWLEVPESPRAMFGWQWHRLYDAGWIMSLIGHDMDGDGDLDIVATDRKGDSRGTLWLENPLPGRSRTGSWTEHRIGGSGREVMFATLADLDEDGLVDVLAATRDGGILYHRQRSAGAISWATSEIQLPSGAGTGKGVAVGDIDLDGQLDVVFSCENAGDRSGVMWLSYQNSPTDSVWVSRDISRTVGVKFDLVELIDLDGDGDLDVMTCEERSNLGVIWYENPLGS